MRWRKELLDIEKNQTKDFDILNLQDAHETGIALVALCGPLGSPYEVILLGYLTTVGIYHLKVS